MKMNNNLEIYIHIPFCVKKCDYCDFFSLACGDDIKEKYISALVNEINLNANKYKDFKVTSIFIGGGTPSSLEVGLIEKVIGAVNENYDVDKAAEITIECNPGTLTRTKLEEYIRCGINRLSIGLQSANDRELKLLGRIHNYETFLNNYKLAREIGFKNINIDLMSGLPGQLATDFEETLNKIVKLNPEHISAYGLIIEEGTPFYEIYSEGKSKEDELPTEEIERAIYYRTREILEANGYHQYEISNYAKEGYECRHNIGYWRRDNYVGFGAGASSMVRDVRWKNVCDISNYLVLFGGYSNKCDYNNTEGNVYDSTDNNVIDSIYDEEPHILTIEEQMEEYMFLGLRMTSGVSLIEFENEFGKSIYDIEEYNIHTNKMIEEGLLISNSGRLALTYKGLDLANYVMSGYII